MGAGEKWREERWLEVAGLETCPGFGEKGKEIPRKAFALVSGFCDEFVRR